MTVKGASQLHNVLVQKVQVFVLIFTQRWVARKIKMQSLRGSWVQIQNNFFSTLCTQYNARQQPCLFITTPNRPNAEVNLRLYLVPLATLCPPISTQHCSQSAKQQTKTFFSVLSSFASPPFSTCSRCPTQYQVTLSHRRLRSVSGWHSRIKQSEERGASPFQSNK